MKTKEQDLVNAIKKYLEMCGHYVVRVNTGNIIINNNNKFRKIQLAERGTPDLLTCIFGKFIGIEVKKDAKEVEKWEKKVKNFLQTGFINDYHLREISQYKAIKSIQKAGGHAFVIGTLDEARQICDIIK